MLSPLCSMKSTSAVRINWTDIMENMEDSLVKVYAQLSITETGVALSFQTC